MKEKTMQGKPIKRKGHCGCLLLAACLLLWGGTARAQGRPDIQWMRGGLGPLVSIAWSSDGQTIACADLYNVKLWRVSDRTLLRTIATIAYGVAFSSDGLTLATANDGVTLWR